VASTDKLLRTIDFKVASIEEPDDMSVVLREIDMV